MNRRMLLFLGIVSKLLSGSVKDLQYRQRTEALRLVRRIRAKQYLLLKLGNILLQVRLYIP
jgi:hypothetical protein